MEESNKIVVKVKYQGLKKEQKDISQPQIVTEWHMQRIFAAIAMLIIFIILPFYYFSGQSIESVEQTGPELKTVEKLPVKQNTQIADSRAKPKPADIAAKKETAAIAIAPPKLTKKETVKKEVIAKPVLDSSILTSQKIVRALLTTDLDNKEPVDNIATLSVNKDKASKVYYFTEIIDMKGQVLYHRWLRNDQLIFKREINILGNRWRAATSKLITYSKAGLWTVRLEDKQGAVLNEIKFEVIKE